METAMLNVNYHHPLIGRIANRRHHDGFRPLSLIAGIARHYRQRRELNALLGLADYQLKDIGLTRSDIQRESVKPLWRE
jgi:uncharacterized protein YjiS (DUF1127 family)